MSKQVKLVFALSVTTEVSYFVLDAVRIHPQKGKTPLELSCWT